MIVTSVTVLTTKSLFDMCDCTVDSGVGTSSGVVAGGPGGWGRRSP